LQLLKPALLTAASQHPVESVCYAIILPCPRRYARNCILSDFSICLFEKTNPTLASLYMLKVLSVRSPRLPTPGKFAHRNLEKALIQSRGDQPRLHWWNSRHCWPIWKSSKSQEALELSWLTVD